MGVNKLFERGVALEPRRPCLVDAQVSRSYQEVDARRLAIAAALATDGLLVGDKCAVYSPNCTAAFECILGIYRAGGVFVPLNPKNAVGDNIFVAQDCEVSVLFFHSTLAEDVQAIRAACPGVRRIVCIDADSGKDMGPGLARWLESAGEPPAITQDPNRLVSIYSTGGTTGKPKGVMFTPLTWETMAANMFEAIPLHKPPVYLVISPMTHAAGTIGILMMGRGATTIIHERFDAEAVLRTIEDAGVTHLYLPPTAIYMLLSHPDVRKYNYASLEAFIYTSAPMSTTKLKDCLEIFGPVMIQFWGQTEAPIFCTALRQADHVLTPGESERRLASCGRPMLLTPVEVMDDDGRLLHCGEKGELVVRGNLVMTGYYKNEAATREASLHGWHHTGDVGYRDEDGFVYIVDRKKDMIISGGFNVYPSEIEQVIMRLAEVQDCAVVGAPDEKWGESVTAVLELRPGCSLDPAAVQALCKRELGSVKTPKAVQVWPALPRTSVGKVDKKNIRAGFWAGLDRVI